MSWAGYVEALKARFGDKMFGDLMLEMRNLRQEGSLAEYQRLFDGLLHRWQLVEKVSEKMTISQFIGGLELQLQGQVRLQRVQTLHEAFVVAKLHDSVLAPQRAYRPGNILSSSKSWNNVASTKQVAQSYNAPRATAATSASSQPKTNYISSSRSGTESRSSRVTTSREMEARRAKGLCYWCP